MISAITPTHSPEFLHDLYESLKAQTYKNWEWVVCPNGSATPMILAQLKAYNDPRIKVFPVPAGIGQNIGALKHYGFSMAWGDLLVEMDHDDWLHETCFEKLDNAAAGHTECFIYSHSLGLWADGNHETYSEAHGWKTKPVEYKGRTYANPVPFPITPRSLAEIYYAPNHVRAWSRAAYAKLGGHNASLSVADDHDLMCRTYIEGILFIEIPEVLYYQRRHGRSTCIVRQPEVGRLTSQVKDVMLHPMIFRWCKDENLEMIDLGGAHSCPKEHGFVALDVAGGKDVKYDFDVLSDEFLSKIKDDSVGCFRASDFLEHIPIGKTVELMNRLYDKLAPGGWLISATPSVVGPDGVVGRGAFQDPTHCSFYSTNNFWYFTDKQYSKYVPDIYCRFQAVTLNCVYPNQWCKDNGCPYVLADLLAIKDQRRMPGIIKI